MEIAGQEETAAQGGEGELAAIRVIQATAAEAGEAHRLLGEYFEEVGVVLRDTPDAIEDLLRAPDAALWIAYADGAAAGCVELRPLPDMRAALECKRLYVRGAFRGRGVASALLDAAEAWARERTAVCIYLDSKDDLRAALALYERRGYEPCERYNRNPQATVFLRKFLCR